MDHIPHFGMEWSGSRVTWQAKNLPLVGDVDLSSADISPFRDGGQIPNFRTGGQIPGGVNSTVGRVEMPPTPRTQAARRTGGASASLRPSSSGSSSPVHRHRDHGGGIAPASASLRPAVGVGLGGRRQKHEIAPGIPCSTCALGVTIPVR